MNHLQQVGMSVIFIWRISKKQRGLLDTLLWRDIFPTQSSFGPKSCYFFPPGLDTILFLFCNLTIPQKMATCIRNPLVSYCFHDFFYTFRDINAYFVHGSIKKNLGCSILLDHLNQKSRKLHEMSSLTILPIIDRGREYSFCT